MIGLACTLCLLGALREPSGPESRGLDLEWSAPTSCASPQSVHREVDRLLGESSADRSRVSARAEVREEGGGYSLRLQLQQGEDTSSRTLTTSTCEQAVDAAALLIAIAIDPAVVPISEAEAEAEAEAGSIPESEAGSIPESEAGSVPEPEPEPEPEPDPEPEPEPKAEADSDLEPAAEPEPRAARFVPRVQALARGGASVGVAPGWGGFVELGAGTAWRWVEVHAAASGWLPRSDTAGDVGGRFQLWTGGLRGCPVLRPRRDIDVPLCVGLHAGAMIGRGETGLQGRRETQPWVGASLGPALRVRVHDWVALQAGVDGWLSIVRPAFDTDQGTFVHRADRVGATLTLGLVVGRAPSAMRERTNTGSQTTQGSGQR